MAVVFRYKQRSVTHNMNMDALALHYTRFFAIKSHLNTVYTHPALFIISYAFTKYSRVSHIQYKFFDANKEHRKMGVHSVSLTLCTLFCHLISSHHNIQAFSTLSYLAHLPTYLGIDHTLFKF